MKFGRLLVFHLALLLGILPLRAATLPQTVTSGTNREVIKTSVDPFVKQQAAKLGNSDTAVQKEGREALVAEVQVPPASLSNEFRDVYAKSVNDTLKPLTTNPDPHVRLNTAVTVARVAEKAGNTQLVPIIVDILKDDSAGVALWGMKASKYVLTPVLSNAVVAKTSPLLPALKDAVKKHVNSGPIIQAAHEATKIDAATPPTSIPGLVDLVQDVVAIRVEQFETGLPASAPSENSPVYMLTSQKVWNAQTPQQQLRTVQLITDVVYFISQRVATASPADLNELRAALDKIGEALFVVVESWVKDQPATEKLRSLKNLSGTSSIEDVKRAVDPVYDTLKTIPQFKDLKRPKELQALSAAPSTTPATVPGR